MWAMKHAGQEPRQLRVIGAVKRLEGRQVPLGYPFQQTDLVQRLRRRRRIAPAICPLLAVQDPPPFAVDVNAAWQANGSKENREVALAGGRRKAPYRRSARNPAAR
jgi:hypothetical protein